MDPQHNALAWSSFVGTYGAEVVAWCRRYGLQDADARDIAQDVLVRFWQQSTRFKLDSSRSFRAYLKVITHAAWADWCERSKPWGTGEGGSQIIGLLQQIPARDYLLERLEHVYDQEVFQSAVKLVRRRVKPRTWEAFRLLAMEHRTGKDVAQRLNMNLDNVFSARKVVMRMLRETVERIG